MCFAEMSLITHLHLRTEDGHRCDLIWSNFFLNYYITFISLNNFLKFLQFSFLFVSTFENASKWKYSMAGMIYWVIICCFLFGTYYFIKLTFYKSSKDMKQDRSNLRKTK